jgi:orotidine-5'-phosphate decarboxylase
VLQHLVSNPEGRLLQTATQHDGLSVETALLGQIAELNEKLSPGLIGPVGAVIGPTHSDVALDLEGANALFLAPGVGAQGATALDVQRVFANCLDRTMPSASRALLTSPEVNQLRDRAASMAAEFRALLGAS